MGTSKDIEKQLILLEQHKLDVSHIVLSNELYGGNSEQFSECNKRFSIRKGYNKLILNFFVHTETVSLQTDDIVIEIDMKIVVR